ncbi:AMP-binding protein [Peribacillus butanolivorans]
MKGNNNMNITDQITMYKDICPEKVAVQLGTRQLTYSALVDSMNQIANGLSNVEHSSKSNIAILMSNCVEFIQIFVGVVKAGLIPVPLDPKWSASEIRYVLTKCEPALLFIEGSLADKVEEKGVPTIIVEPDGTEDDFSNWLASNAVEEPITPLINEVLFLGFTSGTTGTPKGYIRTHLSWLESFYSTNKVFNLKFCDHILAPGPLVHSLSLFAAIQTLFIGATFHIIRKFTPADVLKVCQHVEETTIFLVPTMIQAIMDYAVRAPHPYYVPKAVISSGAKWSAASKEGVMEVFPNLDIYEFYGSSEASYISYLTPQNNRLKPDTVGKPFPQVKISIRDMDGKEVKTGEVGQLFVSSEMIFSGYFQQEDETNNVLKDNWLKLGDYARRDEEGYLYIEGRAKNMIVSGGLNIFPEEIERVLMQLPEIEAVMVTSLPDAYWGEKVIVLVQWKQGYTLDLKEVKSHCRKYLASYKTPQELIEVTAFPYTSSGKIARNLVKQQMIEVCR